MSRAHQLEPFPPYATVISEEAYPPGETVLTQDEKRFFFSRTHRAPSFLSRSTVTDFARFRHFSTLIHSFRPLQAERHVTGFILSEQPLWKVKLTYRLSGPPDRLYFSSTDYISSDHGDGKNKNCQNRTASTRNLDFFKKCQLATCWRLKR